MTPKEFKQKMKKIQNDRDGNQEEVHRAMDDLLCDLLTELGYGEGVEIFKETDKWYA